MSVASDPKSVLVVEPNTSLDQHYAFFDQVAFELTRCNNPSAAREYLEKQKFSLVCLSCSFSNKKMLSLLESVKNASQTSIIPLLLVVDLKQPYSIVPGLTWNGQLALLSSISTSQDLQLQLEKLL